MEHDLEALCRLLVDPLAEALAAGVVDPTSGEVLASYVQGGDEGRLVQGWAEGIARLAARIRTGPLRPAEAGDGPVEIEIGTSGRVCFVRFVKGGLWTAFLLAEAGARQELCRSQLATAVGLFETLI